MEMMGSNTAMVHICRAFVDLLLLGVLQDVMHLGLGIEQILERSQDFKFTEEEEAILNQFKEDRNVTTIGA